MTNQRPLQQTLIFEAQKFEDVPLRIYWGEWDGRWVRWWHLDDIRIALGFKTENQVVITCVRNTDHETLWQIPCEPSVCDINTINKDTKEIEGQAMSDESLCRVFLSLHSKRAKNFKRWFFGQTWVPELSLPSQN